MCSNALYYPYIRVPEGPWFTRVLLYWDRVGAIVPYDYIQYPKRLGPYMVSLVRENLIEQVIPGKYLWRVENFSGAFIDYADAKYGVDGAPYRSNWATDSPEKRRGTAVHMEKLQDLGAILCERGMAKKDETDPYSPWFVMEPRIAADFMAYLAGVLGQMADDTHFSPITDLHSNLDSFNPQEQPRDPKYRVRQILLEGILPSPAKQLEAGKLIDFKEKYSGLLKEFRKQVEDKVSELAAISEEELMRMRMDDITHSFTESIDEIANRMKEQKNWPDLDFGTLCAIAGSGLAAWKAVLDQDWKFGVTGAALGLAPAVYSAFRGSDFNWSDQPLAYAALAKNRL